MISYQRILPFSRRYVLEETLAEVSKSFLFQAQADNARQLDSLAASQWQHIYLLEKKIDAKFDSIRAMLHGDFERFSKRLISQIRDDDDADWWKHGGEADDY
jgi:hypothetical protein